MFSKNQLDKFREEYFFNGFIFLSDYQQKLKYFLKIINKLNLENNLFEINKKNVFTSTLNQSLLDKETFNNIDNIIKELGIIDLANLITCRDLYQTNFMHFLSKGRTPSLPWHRDTFKTFGDTVGSIPSATKIAIFSSKVTSKTAPLEMIPGSHRFDFQNKFLDRIQPYFCLKKYSVRANPGDIIIFDSSILHRRASCKRFALRSATIFGLISEKLIRN